MFSMFYLIDLFKDSKLYKSKLNFSEGQSMEKRPHFSDNCKRRKYCKHLFGLPVLTVAQSRSNWIKQDQCLPKLM